MPDLPFITIITSFSGRMHCLDRFLASLDSIDYPKDKIGLIFCDASEQGIKDVLDSVGNTYNRYSFIRDSRKPMTGITAGEQSKSIRIASVYSMMREVYQSDSKYVLSWEDDIEPPKDGLKKLVDIMEIDEKIGCAFGRQICRWMELPLVWKFTKKSVFGTKDSSKEFGVSVEILPVKDSGIEKVDGMPMGFNLIRSELFKQENFRASDFGLIGFDLIFSEDINRAGFSTVIDWSIHCKHYHEVFLKSEFGSYKISKVLQ
jgi:hypothetical protein